MRRLPDVPLVRVAVDDLTKRMTEYVVMHVLMHHRRQGYYAESQRERVWAPKLQWAARDLRVGIMGLGVLGRDAAEVLARIGFDVAGWSNTPKSIPGIACYAGEAQLGEFLARTDVLVCLLPLTPQTRGILNRKTFGKLARDGKLGGPVIINAGRGGLQVEDDILACLDDGTLAAATLDVFGTEPLPADSPFWAHPKVTLSPHNAADTDPDAISVYVAEQIAAFERGERARRTSSTAASGYLNPLHARDVAACRRDARERGRDRLDGDAHVKRIGVNEIRAVAHDRDMPLPEDKIAAARLRDVDRLAERGFLHVAVARAGDAAGVERNLHEAGAIEPEIGLAAPQIRDPEEAFGDRDEVLLALRERRDVAERNEAERRHGEAVLLARHRDAAAERRHRDRRQLDRGAGERERARRDDLVRRRVARRASGRSPAATRRSRRRRAGPRPSLPGRTRRP